MLFYRVLGVHGRVCPSLTASVPPELGTGSTRGNDPNRFGSFGTNETTAASIVRDGSLASGTKSRAPSTLWTSGRGSTSCPLDSTRPPHIMPAHGTFRKRGENPLPRRIHCRSFAGTEPNAGVCSGTEGRVLIGEPTRGMHRNEGSPPFPGQKRPLGGSGSRIPNPLGFRRVRIRPRPPAAEKSACERDRRPIVL